jgi:hypothetical protein
MDVASPNAPAPTDHHRVSAYSVAESTSPYIQAAAVHNKGAHREQEQNRASGDTTCPSHGH